MSYLDRLKKNNIPQFTFIPTVIGASEKFPHVYVDGSYDTTRKVAGFGVVVKDKTGVIYKGHGHVDDTPYGSRNITGEIIGAIAGLKWADRRLYEKVIIFHDYIGLGMWSQTWKAKSQVAIKYKEYLAKVKCQVEFRHVKGHTGNLYNEMADKEAEQGKFGKLYKF